MTPPKKIHDLIPRSAEHEIVLSRPRRPLVHALHLSQRPARTGVEFDLRRKKTESKEDTLFLPVASGSRSAWPQLKVAASALILVLLLNLFGTFGAGKSKVEKVFAGATAGLGGLVAASENLAQGKFTESIGHFTSAAHDLAAVEQELAQLAGTGAMLTTQSDQIQSGSRLITAGRLIATAGQKFAAAANILQDASSTWLPRQRVISSGEKAGSFTTQLQQASAQILSAATELESASAVLALVDLTSLPAGLQSQVASARSRIQQISQQAKPYLQILPVLPDLLGDRVPRRYLILFQNSDEIRPTGGFIGSFATLELNDGFISKFEIRDIYELDGQLAEKIPPPEGFGFITDRWGMRDANYHPDFAVSAAAAAQLFELGGAGTVDGVVAVTSDLLTRLATLTQGVELTRYGEKVPAAELTQLMSLVIESKLDGAAAPKQILPEIWEALKTGLQQVAPAELVQASLEAIAAKEIQAWSSRPEYEQVAKTLRLAGELDSTSDESADYLFVVDTSLSGNKSDRYTQNAITHSTKIYPDGRALDTLTLTRTHSWSEAAATHLRDLATEFGVPLDEKLIDLLGRGRNVDLIKIFVPSGSELVAVEGLPENRIETLTSSNKTYFQFTLTTQPGSSRLVTLTYQLPQKFTSGYRLVTGRQAGVAEAKIQKSISHSSGQKSAEVLLGSDFLVEWR